MTDDALDTVLVGGEYRVAGAVSAEELEELERAHDAGDIRMDSRLHLLLNGRPGDRALVVPQAPPPGFWHNHAHPCGVEGCVGFAPGARTSQPPTARKLLAR